MSCGCNQRYRPAPNMLPPEIVPANNIVGPAVKTVVAPPKPAPTPTGNGPGFPEGSLIKKDS